MAIYHCQLGGLSALVDAMRERVKIPPTEDTSGRTRYRPVRDAYDAATVALDAWGQPERRRSDVKVRIATEADLALFARVAAAGQRWQRFLSTTVDQRSLFS